MSWLRILCAVWLLSRCSAEAFVVNHNSAGKRRHWNLTTSDPRVNANVVNPKTRAIRYYLGSNTYSSANAEAELNAIRAAFDQWQSIPGTILKFEEGGLVGPGVDVNVMDHTNVIFWAKTSTLVNGGLDNISGYLGVTYTSTFDDNTIHEADTVLNGMQFSWFTDFNTVTTGAYFIEADALHEIGHFIGLDHSPVGAATMFVRGLGGVGTQAGLSVDDIAGAVFLYPKAPILNTFGTLQGQVTLNGEGILGVVVTLEDLAGNVIAGTVSRADAKYELNVVPPGDYLVRVSPLDPDVASYLLRGLDIDRLEFPSAKTDFQATTNHPIKIMAGNPTTLDFQVEGGSPPFRITRIRPPSELDEHRVVNNAPTSVRPGHGNFYVGVYSPDLPTQDATLTITGDGLTLGPTTFLPNAFPGLNLMSILCNVASNATPGLRSFAVQQGDHVAYANGFIEVLPLFPDYNFDGLDDTFQRKYFTLFTAAEAAPLADPDGDGFTNVREYRAGSDPTNPFSFFFRIESIKLTTEGTTITFQTGQGKRYQVYSRPDVAGGPWEAIGPSITASEDISEFFDSSATNTMRFYRVLAVP